MILLREKKKNIFQIVRTVSWRESANPNNLDYEIMLGFLSLPQPPILDQLRLYNESVYHRVVF